MKLTDEEIAWLRRHVEEELKRYEMNCPNCNQADLEEFGSKMRCPRCRYVEPCCTTDCPSR